jgi:hypothetical protein
VCSFICKVKTVLNFSLVHFFWWWYWGLNSGPYLVGRYSTTWTSPPILFALVIFEIRFNFLPRLTSYCCLTNYGLLYCCDDRHVSLCWVYWLRCGLAYFLPDLYLPSPWHYRCEPPQWPCSLFLPPSLPPLFSPSLPPLFQTLIQPVSKNCLF